MPGRLFSDQEELNIVSTYKNNRISARQLSVKYDCAPNTILYILHKHGIDTSIRYVRSNLFHFNKHAFDSLDHEAPIYWLGFIYADGHVTPNHNSLHVRLSNKDIEHLEKLNKFLHSTYSIYISPPGHGSGESACLAVTNYHFANRLKELGIITARPSIAPTVAEIDDALMHHFLRGLFDGDGCAAQTKPQISWAGKLHTASFVRQILSKHTNTNPKQKLIKNTVAECYSVWYGGKRQISTIAQWLYKDATVWLERKRDIIESY